MTLLEASNVPVRLDAMLPGNEALLKREIACALGVDPVFVRGFELLKRSVDARKKSNVHFVATFSVKLDDAAKANSAKGVNVKPYAPREALAVPDCAAALSSAGEARPVVVGTGPAGLFAALFLARAGLRPLVVERGAAVEDRLRAVEAFASGGALDTATNIQFGEGGAGTFSDGKLNTGTKSPHIRHVLEEFVAAGAPPEVLVDAKPHIGTDKLVDVVANLRRAIIAAGGEVRFNTQLVGFGFEEPKAPRQAQAQAEGQDAAKVEAAGAARLSCVRLRDVKTGVDREIPATRVILACGHSARDTFALLQQAGVVLERKPFAVGVRIEHPQSLIDRAQYGDAAGHPALGAADYKLAVHTRDGRGVYTFCMCPGGEVVAAASEEGGVCVNGMSRHARNGRNANSALLVGVNPDDFPGNDPLAGVAFQREIEHAAFELGRAGGRLDYTAPAQTVEDFLATARAGAGENARGAACGSARKAGALVEPTYPRGVAWANLHDCLPAFVTDAIAEGLPLLDRKLRGFAHPQAVMTGVEARSSSPVRIVRDEGFQSHSHRGLYPCGEGAGYAGGITSAAVDGLRVAEALAADVLRAGGL